ncbi:Hcp1 family type VI secretion system effector [Massilia sp. TW-1]|uniref:Hcp1 family type VI secretion system effector n=1 Tax=Telluria antibiotica TaxID=2717319 RepID=A0ABX0PHK8_9BURK|nr:type VI secretion system tube protein Hcp [Telluria antibiotica]NIA55929.1 Hcp1 family type VI secretion system effector [Telluria antibiotica]
MAIDVYLQLDGIRGESADGEHPGRIECAPGRTIPKARFEFFRADGQGTRVKYYEVELDNVVIGDVAQSVAAGIGMLDHVGLKFSRVKWRYTQQRIAGGAGGNTAGGWDLATNRVA